MTPAQYADLVIRAVDTSDGETLRSLFVRNDFSATTRAIRLHDRQRQQRQYGATLEGNSATESILPLLRDARPQRIQSALLKCNGFLASPWLEIVTNHLVVAARMAAISPLPFASTHLAAAVTSGSDRNVRESVQEAWEAFNALISTFLRMFASVQHARWCLPTLLLLLSDYRRLSVLADDVDLSSRGESSGSRNNHMHLEECARQLNKAFSACVADRTTEEEHSRKWATYEVVGLVFRVYFKLKSLGLCRNILRALAAADLPNFERFPRAQRVTFKYYIGVLAFLNEEYSKAESELTYGFINCHADAQHNQEMILQYLIPCRMLRGTLPSTQLLARFPRLANLYGPFVFAVRSSDVQAYDRALALPAVEKALVQHGTFLAIERAREICLRGLLKRVYRCRDRKSRIALQDFHCALRFVGVDLQLLETEWLVATQIAKGYIRGYISHSHMMAVLSAQNAFPSLQSIPVV